MCKRKGFTLVELLAVIVILAIILTIALPSISNIIRTTASEAFTTDTKMLLKAVSYKLLEDEDFDITTINETNLSSTLNLSANNYDEIVITNIANEINIVVVGKGKWSNLAAYGPRSNITVEYLPDGLVGYWKMDGNANDSSTNNNNGVVNGASLTTDSKTRGNRAYLFDGVDDFINVPYSATLAPTSSMSFGFWVYKSSWDTLYGRSTVFMSKTESGGYNCSADSDAGSGYIGCLVRRNSTYGMVKVQYTTFASGWHHFMSTYDGRYIKLYVDGTLRDTNDALSNYNIQYACSNNLSIGAESGCTTTPAGSYFTGTMDDVRVYNTSLTAEEVKLLYDFNK